MRNSSKAADVLGTLFAVFAVLVTWLIGLVITWSIIATIVYLTWSWLAS